MANLINDIGGGDGSTGSDGKSIPYRPNSLKLTKPVPKYLQYRKSELDLKLFNEGPQPSRINVRNVIFPDLDLGTSRPIINEDTLWDAINKPFSTTDKLLDMVDPNNVDDWRDSPSSTKPNINSTTSSRRNRNSRGTVFNSNRFTYPVFDEANQKTHKPSITQNNRLNEVQFNVSDNYEDGNEEIVEIRNSSRFSKGDLDTNDFNGSDIIDKNDRNNNSQNKGILGYNDSNENVIESINSKRFEKGDLDDNSFGTNSSIIENDRNDNSQNKGILGYNDSNENIVESVNSLRFDKGDIGRQTINTDENNNIGNDLGIQFDNDLDRDYLERDETLYNNNLNRDYLERDETLYNNDLDREYLEKDMELFDNSGEEREILDGRQLYDNNSDREYLEKDEILYDNNGEDREILDNEVLYDNSVNREYLEKSEQLYDNSINREYLEKDEVLYNNSSEDREILKDNQLFDNSGKDRKVLKDNELYDNSGEDRKVLKDEKLYDNSGEDRKILEDKDIYPEQPPKIDKKDKIISSINSGRKPDNIGKDLGSLY
jgi:hypothetical protein